MEELSGNPLDNEWFLLFISLLYFYGIFTIGSIYWITIPLYLIVIMRYIVKSIGYGYKLYFSSIFSLVVLEGLLLTYIYLFNSVLLKTPVNRVAFFIFVIVTIVSLFLYIRLIVTGEYKKLPM